MRVVDFKNKATRREQHSAICCGQMQSNQARAFGRVYARLCVCRYFPSVRDHGANISHAPGQHIFPKLSQGGGLSLEASPLTRVHRDPVPLQSLTRYHALVIRA